MRNTHYTGPRPRVRSPRLRTSASSRQGPIKPCWSATTSPHRVLPVRILSRLSAPKHHHSHSFKPTPHTHSPCSPVLPPSLSLPSPSLRPLPLSVAVTAAPGLSNAATPCMRFVFFLTEGFSIFVTEPVLQSNESAIAVLLGLLGLDVGSVTGQVGLQCSGIDAVGVGSSNACSSNAVCCQNNNVVSTDILRRNAVMLTRMSSAGWSHLHRLRTHLPLSKGSSLK